jgi:tetratricopeptide (TPR) repeat protein
VLDRLLTRRNLILAVVACAFVLGAAGWLLGGLVWSIVGVVAGPPILLLAVGIYVAFLPEPTVLIAKGRPQQALRLVQRTEREVRQMARKWPSQFRDMLAYRLAEKSDALHALGQDEQALGAADESVAIYQALAAESPAKHTAHLSQAIDSRSRALAGLGQHAEAITAIDTAIRAFRNLAIADPDKYLPVLAEALTCKAGWLADIHLDTEALTTAHEAATIYWHKLPSTRLCVYAARAALLEGEILSRQDRHTDAARMLARGWALADRQQQQETLCSATPAIRAAYHADPEGFSTAWRAETSSEPPSWLES